ERTPVTVIADPADCTFQLDLTGGAQQFATSCDIAKSSLSNAGVGYQSEAGPPGQPARIRIGEAIEIESVSAVGQTLSQIRATRAEFAGRLREALTQAGYPAEAPGAMQNWSLAEIGRVFAEKWGVIAIMALFIVAACAL